MAKCWRKTFNVVNDPINAIKKLQV